MSNFSMSDLPPAANSFLSLLIAFMLGTLIGLERQYRQRTAGLRTNVLVQLARQLSPTWACDCWDRRVRHASSPTSCQASASWAQVSS